jgi:hypothetical protein
MIKYKWILIGLVLVIAAGIIFYGTSVTMCEPPCV